MKPIMDCGDPVYKQVIERTRAAVWYDIQSEIGAVWLRVCLLLGIPVYNEIEYIRQEVSRNIENELLFNYSYYRGILK